MIENRNDAATELDPFADWDPKNASPNQCRAILTSSAYRELTQKFQIVLYNLTTLLLGHEYGSERALAENAAIPREFFLAIRYLEKCQKSEGAALRIPILISLEELHDLLLANNQRLKQDSQRYSKIKPDSSLSHSDTTALLSSFISLLTFLELPLLAYNFGAYYLSVNRSNQRKSSSKTPDCISRMLLLVNDHLEVVHRQNPILVEDTDEEGDSDLSAHRFQDPISGPSSSLDQDNYDSITGSHINRNDTFDLLMRCGDESLLEESGRTSFSAGVSYSGSCGDLSSFHEAHSQDDGREIRKRVRFSLGPCHMSPEQEEEFGGRSNRRRLKDFAMRKQMFSNSNHYPGSNSRKITRGSLFLLMLQYLIFPAFLLFGDDDEDDDSNYIDDDVKNGGHHFYQNNICLRLTIKAICTLYTLFVVCLISFVLTTGAFYFFPVVKDTSTAKVWIKLFEQFYWSVKKPWL